MNRNSDNQSFTHDNAPLVSVVIPSYNRSRVITDSVRSVLDQSYPNLELFVVDDGSTDDTKKVLEEIRDPRLHYVYQENQGACAARNHGASLAAGDFVAFHDSDDLWHADKLEIEMQAMLEHKADVVICKQIHILPDGTTRLTPKRIGEGFLTQTDDLHGIGTQTILTRKAVLEKEAFDPAMPRLQDLEWLYRVRKHYRIYCVAQGLVDYIVGEDSITTNHEKRYRAILTFLEKHGEARREQPVLCLHMIKDLLESWQAVRRTHPEESRKYLLLIRRLFPGIGALLRTLLRR